MAHKSCSLGLCPRGGLRALLSALISTHLCTAQVFLRGHLDLCYGPLTHAWGCPTNAKGMSLTQGQ